MRAPTHGDRHAVRKHTWLIAPPQRAETPTHVWTVPWEREANSRKRAGSRRPEPSARCWPRTRSVRTRRLSSPTAASSSPSIAPRSRPTARSCCGRPRIGAAGSRAVRKTGASSIWCGSRSPSIRCRRTWRTSGSMTSTTISSTTCARVHAAPASPGAARRAPTCCAGTSSPARADRCTDKPRIPTCRSWRRIISLARPST